MLRLSGGAWAYAARLFDSHPEVTRFEIEDESAGTRYATDRATFEAHAWRQDLGAGEQIILALKYWQIERSAPSAASMAAVQLGFDLWRAGRAAW